MKSSQTTFTTNPQHGLSHFTGKETGLRKRDDFRGLQTKVITAEYSRQPDVSQERWSLNWAWKMKRILANTQEDGREEEEGVLAGALEEQDPEVGEPKK